MIVGESKSLQGFKVHTERNYMIKSNSGKKLNRSQTQATKLNKNSKEKGERKTTKLTLDSSEINPHQMRRIIRHLKTQKTK